MENAIYDLLNSVTTTPQPELRNTCLELLDLEIAQAENEVFGESSAVATTVDYTEAYEAAKRSRAAADIKRWLSYEQLNLPLHWMILIGFRLSVEQGLPLGGLPAVHLRAAETLALSPAETREWDVELLWQVCLNTGVRSEWNYDGLHFRFEQLGD